LLLLVNYTSLHSQIPGELGKSFGTFRDKPSTAFSPAAVTTGGMPGIPLL
jgi:fumarylacetoacetate (FAA) hydrolase